MTSQPRRRTSHGSSFAGSMLSLITGRPSTQARSPLHMSQDYTDYRHVPNGHMDHFSPHLRHDRFVSVDMGLRSNGGEQGEFSSWSSDSELRKGNRVVNHFGRERSHTDANERDLEKDMKKERHRKVSFPLSLLRRLRSHSEKSYPGSSKSVHYDSDPDATPEYVPLRRATLIQEANKLSKPTVDRKRKLSYPLGMLKRNHSDSSEGCGSVESVPAEVLTSQTKPSRRRTVQFDPLTYFMNDPDQPPRGLHRSRIRSQRRARDLEGFTVENVTDGCDVDETVSAHRRNAQIIEKAMAGKAVSRAPLLSAIEEGGTITSLTQILPSDEDEDAEESERMELIQELHEEQNPETNLENETAIHDQRPSFIIPTITIDDYS
ncbi:uncharacterized protein LOC110441321 isoform X1 [Mizuhopecten yessoensis]|uniref:uncharacterized protein LOC110441321 isoform X1 n=1 Tax=Mizuhopecten yessoensis TaxID=6573 RepID=UPI000B457600|nr:uncharacterized protein LOC110441321 isoform X1 [Mizuhopecten yessoensis]